MHCRARLRIFYTGSLSCGEACVKIQLSIFYAESLGCGETCVESQTQHFYAKASGYGETCGEPDPAFHTRDLWVEPDSVFTTLSL